MNNSINFFSDDSDNIFEEFASLKSTLAKNWNELVNSLHSNPKCIVFHIDMIQSKKTSVSEFLNMLETFIRFNDPETKPNIAVVINHDTNVSLIKELQRNKILGIIPSWDKEELKDAIKAVLSARPHWPKHIINKLPGHVEKTNKEIHLTDRQYQVYDLIANRGLSNKQIAKILKISESTVKIHVSAILKNLCVRNRTQLALTKI